MTTASVNYSRAIWAWQERTGKGPRAFANRVARRLGNRADRVIHSVYRWRDGSRRPTGIRREAVDAILAEEDEGSEGDAMDILFDFDRFDELLLEKGWGPQDLWKAAIRKGEDISQASIRNWAARCYPPKLPNIRMLADVFGVDIQQLAISAANVEDAAKSEEAGEAANGSTPAANVT